MKSTTRANILFAISIALVAAIFVVDWLTPLDYVAWLSYLLPVFLIAWAKPRPHAYLLVAVCTLLIGIDLVATSAQPRFLIALVDGVASIVVLWIVAFFNGRLRDTQNDLRQARDALELRVRERTAELERTNRALQAEIADHEQAEAALSESQERFRSVLENSLDAVYRRDLRTDRYDYMSPVFERITSWSVQDMNPTDTATVVARMHPDDRAAVEREIERTFAVCEAEGIATSVLEYRLMGKDGRYRWLGDHITVLAGPDGRPLYRLGIVRDIAERKHAEQLRAAHLKSLEFLSTSAAHLLENMPSGEIFRYAAEQLRAITGRAIVIVNEYRLEADQTIVQAALGPDDKMQKLHGLLGRDPTGLIFTAAPNIRERMVPGGLADLEGGLYDLTFNRLPQPLCEQIERELDMGSIYAMPFVFDRDFVGMAAIITDRAEGLQNRALIESLVNQTGLALQRKRTEEALQESEQRYHSLFNGMTEGFALHEIICDENDQPIDYRFLDINPAFERLTGLSRQDVIGRTHNQILPGDSPAWVQKYGAVALTGEPVQFEDYSPVLKRHYQVFAYRPAPRQFAVVFIDVTERKQMEEALRVNLAKYSVLFGSFPLGITVADEAGTILETNQEAVRLLDVPVGEHTRRQIDGPQWQIIRPDGTPMPSKEYASVRALKENRRVENVEMGIVKPEGVTWISVTAAPLPIPGYGVVITYGDITQRKRAEQALAESEERYRTLVELAPEGIAVHAEGKWLYVNPAGLKLLGAQDPSEIVGQPVLDFVHPDDRDAVRARMSQALRDPRPTARRDFRMIRRDGQLVDVETTGALTTFQGRPAVVIVIGDISERKQGEQERERLLAQVEAQKEAALQEREQATRRAAELDATISAIADGVIIFGAQGQVLSMNAASRRITGLYPEQLNLPMAERLALMRLQSEDGQPAIDLEDLPFRQALRGDIIRNWLLAFSHSESGRRTWISTSAAPIRTPDGRTLGAVTTFTDVTELHNVQQQLAEANVRLQDQNQELATLLHVSHALASTLEMDALMGIILDNLRTVAPYTDATIYALEGQDLIRMAFRGQDLLPEPGSPVRISLADAPVHARVVSSREAVIIPDVWADTPEAQALRASPLSLLQVRLPSLRSWIGIPLAVQQRVIGMLVLHHDQPDFYHARRAELAQAFANQAAVAMDNARLVEQSRELAVVEERQRLARDLHDAVSQTLFAASIIADVLPDVWERSPDQARQRLQELRRLTRGAFAEMRMLLLELRPNILIQTPLPDLIKQLADGTRGRSHLNITVKLDGKPALPPDVHLALYRIAQEALNNVVKHARAGHVVMELYCLPAAPGKPDSVELSVQDDGKGFDPHEVSGEHLGLNIMRERAGSIGAQLQITSRPGGGTCVRVVWSHTPENIAQDALPAC